MPQQYKRIFAALDGGSTQRAVAERAISIAEKDGADILFGHVIDSVPYEANGVDFAALCEAGAQRIEMELADILEDARANTNVGSVDLKVAAGRINETIAEQLVEPYGPDLVICGERGLSNIRYAFVGSVSTYLIRNMDCDVLVLKQR
ncbi:MAG: universal stress protein [Coriobacteriia bacterium]|nr:universal stress protein [Coriobacteriia bacterium]